MSRNKLFHLMAAFAVTAAFGAASAAELDGPMIEKPACEEGKCPTFKSGALKNAVSIPDAVLSSNAAFATENADLSAMAVDSMPTLSALPSQLSCEEGKCPEFKGGALKDASHAVDPATLR